LSAKINKKSLDDKQEPADASARKRKRSCLIPKVRFFYKFTGSSVNPPVGGTASRQSGKSVWSNSPQLAAEKRVQSFRER